MSKLSILTHLYCSILKSQIQIFRIPTLTLSTNSHKGIKSHTKLKAVPGNEFGIPIEKCLVYQLARGQQGLTWSVGWPLEQQQKFSSQRAITWSIQRMKSKDRIWGMQNLTAASLSILPNLHSWIQIFFPFLLHRCTPAAPGILFICCENVAARVSCYS